MTDLVSVLMLAVSMCSEETQEKFEQFADTNPNANEILDYMTTQFDENAIAYLQEQDFKNRVLQGLNV